MQDTIVRTIAAEESLRMVAATTKNLLQKACLIHNCAPTSAAALGRVLTAALMMGSLLKGEETVTIRVIGDGPVGSITVVANAKGDVKGYIQNPGVYLPSKDGKMPVGKAIGKGMLYVIKELRMKEPYTGSVPLVSGEIAEDLTRYFLVSEQIPSAVSLGVLVNPSGIVASGGFIIQMMPGAAEEIAENITDKIKKIGSISRLIESGCDAKNIIDTVLKDYNYKILGEIKARYKCGCNREKLKEILLGLGNEELRRIIEEEGKVEANCHFCNSTFNFNKEEIMELINNQDS